MGSYENSGGGRWESPDMSMLPRPVMLVATGGFQPLQDERRPERRRSRLGTAVAAVVGVAALSGAAIGADAYFHLGYVDRILDWRSGVCMPTRARLDGKSYEVCFNRDSIYPRIDRDTGAITTGAKVESVREVDEAPNASGSTPNTTPPTDTGPALPPEGSPSYYDLVKLMCDQLGADVFQGDIDYIKATLIKRQGKLGRTLPDDPSQLVITSDYSGQPVGGRAAVVKC